MKKRLLLAPLLALYVSVSLSGVSAHAQELTPQQKQIVIIFNGLINDLSIGRLITAVNEEVKQGATAVTILINSNGGGVDAALAGYNYLRGIPVTITVHNFGIVDSSAVILYCAGTKRLAAPDARFVLHGISLTFPPAVPIDENQIGEYTRLLQLQTNTMATIIAKTSGKSLTVTKAAIIDKTVLPAEQAKQWGLVTAIESRLYEDGAKIIIVPMQ
jgi:ATP-dependent Clp protease protease subunit